VYCFNTRKIIPGLQGKYVLSEKEKIRKRSGFQMGQEWVM
jgi:hypothetical protein